LLEFVYFSPNNLGASVIIRCVACG